MEEQTGAEIAAPAVITGEPRVDETLRRLDELAELPVTEHPAVFERVHSQLVEVLGELRSGTDASAARPAVHSIDASRVAARAAIHKQPAGAGPPARLAVQRLA